MQYRKLGNTELDVSLICLGTMTWGEQNTQAQAFAQMDYALERGVNFWDTAEMYPVPPRAATQGRTEEIIGAWFAKTGRRRQVVLATKVTGRGDQNTGMAHVRDGPRLTRSQIFAAVEDSLSRLQTDYIDLYQVHWPERRTNFFGNLGYRHFDDDGVAIGETLQALGDLVQQGKVRYIGVSNETPWGVMEYLRLAERGGLPAIVSIQNPYNLLNRTFEVGLAEMAIRERVGLLAYSPLGFGVLSGKYLNGARPEGARLTLFDRFTRYLGESVVAATRAYVDLATAHGLDPAQMALAFVNSRQFTTANIIGATDMEQLRSNIDSINLSLSKDVLDGINAIHRRYSNPAP
ncbi:NADP(H)-dependent aldo-keto reductase [Exilibacterium tricleocarpae]|uniref:Protein tas n=1 Tax=Exilibacterium tricleocarpae TaxID=2591008 RepID=A0A545UA21_9GAMM|nr:NADP(H)-dependent aldo-keto reductase [Exilibacterium tricleocarpae]TQV86311.1 NADP(H)-dependent aldo-keto reductase [Exilibacterium tricleocarpae]